MNFEADWLASYFAAVANRWFGVLARFLQRTNEQVESPLRPNANDCQLVKFLAPQLSDHFLDAINGYSTGITRLFTLPVAIGWTGFFERFKRRLPLG